MTLDCVRPTQSSDIWIIHHNVCLKFFSFIYQNVCYYCYIGMYHLYFTR